MNAFLQQPRCDLETRVPIVQAQQDANVPHRGHVGQTEDWVGSGRLIRRAFLIRTFVHEVVEYKPRLRIVQTKSFQVELGGLIGIETTSFVTALERYGHLVDVARGAWRPTSSKVVTHHLQKSLHLPVAALSLFG